MFLFRFGEFKLTKIINLISLMILKKKMTQLHQIYKKRIGCFFSVVTDQVQFIKTEKTVMSEDKISKSGKKGD